MPSLCRDFSELVLRAEKDRDYRLVICDRGAEITVVAIHGGGIEPLTSALAAAVAGEEHNLYDLQGLLPGDNTWLRVPAHRFEEARLQALLGRSQTAVSVDGMEGAEPVLYLGGRNRRLKAVLAQALTEAGFVTADLPGNKPAHDPTFFYNRPPEGGVQLVLTRALRASLTAMPLEGENGQGRSQGNQRFAALVAAVRGGLERYRAEVRDDLERTLARFEREIEALPRSLRSHFHCHDAQEP